MGQDSQELATANALLSNDDDNDADLRYLHSLLRDQQHVVIPLDHIMFVSYQHRASLIRVGDNRLMQQAVINGRVIGVINSTIHRNN